MNMFPLPKHDAANLAIGVDLDSRFANQAVFLQAMISNWDGAVIGIMIDKVAGVENMREHGINCHQLLGVESQDAKAEAINGMGFIAIISDDEQLLRCVSIETARLLIIN